MHIDFIKVAILNELFNEISVPRMVQGLLTCV